MVVPTAAIAAAIAPRLPPIAPPMPAPSAALVPSSVVRPSTVVPLKWRLRVSSDITTLTSSRE